MIYLNKTIDKRKKIAAEAPGLQRFRRGLQRPRSISSRRSF